MKSVLSLSFSALLLLISHSAFAQAGFDGSLSDSSDSYSSEDSSLDDSSGDSSGVSSAWSAVGSLSVSASSADVEMEQHLMQDAQKVVLSADAAETEALKNAVDRVLREQPEGSRKTRREVLLEIAAGVHLRKASK